MIHDPVGFVMRNVFGAVPPDRTSTPVIGGGADASPHGPRKDADGGECKGLPEGLHPDIPADEYHRDPCVVPALSSSIAHVLLTQSPLHAWHAHPRLGAGERDAPTARMDRGTLGHLLLLGGGPQIAIVDAADWRTAAAKAARSEAREAGKLPVLEQQYNEAKELSDRLRPLLLGLGVPLDTGAPELTAVWRDSGALCRGRFDLWDEGTATIWDLKFCESAEPASFARYAINGGLDVQRAAYVSAVEALRPELAGRVRFAWVVIEPTAPYAISLIEARGTMRETGATKWHIARDSWAKCLVANQWPGYTAGIVGVEAPQWEVARLMERQLAAMGGGDHGF